MIQLINRLRQWGSDRAFERRVAKWERGECELTEPEHERLLASADPDVLAITLYFGETLSAEEAQALEARLSTDGPFREMFRFIHRAYTRIEDGHHDEALLTFEEEETVREGERRGAWWGRSAALVLGLALISAFYGRLTAGVTMLRERLTDRASTVGFNRPTIVAAARADTAIGFELADVMVRRGSRLTYPEEVRRSGGAGRMSLDGEAAFHSWAAGILLRTPTCVVHMLAGRYAVRSEPHSGITTVTVDSGMAWIESLGSADLGASKHEIITVARTGEHAFMTRDGSSAVMKNFPVARFVPPVGTLENDSSTSQLGARRVYQTLAPMLINVHGKRR